MSNFFKKISTIMTSLSLCFNISGTSSFAVENSDFKNIVKKPSEKSDNKVLVKPVGVALFLTIIGSLAYFCMKNNNDTVPHEFVEEDDVETVSTNQNNELDDQNELADQLAYVNSELPNYIFENLKQYSSPNNSNLEFFPNKESFDKSNKINLLGIDESNFMFVEVKTIEGMRILGSIFRSNEHNVKKLNTQIITSMFGCSGTGKTLFSEYATKGSCDNIISKTIGKVIFEICFNEVKIEVYEIPGDKIARGLYNYYHKYSQFSFGFFKKGNEGDFNNILEEFIDVTGGVVKCLIINNSIKDLKKQN